MVRPASGKRLIHTTLRLLAAGMVAGLLLAQGIALGHDHDTAAQTTGDADGCAVCRVVLEHDDAIAHSAPAGFVASPEGPCRSLGAITATRPAPLRGAHPPRAPPLV